jgi:type IV pilus assembly protein PilV
MHRQKISSRKFVRNGKSAQQGIVLLEALIAILLFSMGILALVGLQGAMIKNTSDAKYRADASFIAQQWIGMIWSNPDNAAAYVIPDSTNAKYDISSLLPSGTRTVTEPVPGQFVVTITWLQPGQPAGQAPHQYTTTAYITGG